MRSILIYAYHAKNTDIELKPSEISQYFLGTEEALEADIFSTVAFHNDRVLNNEVW